MQTSEKASERKQAGREKGRAYKHLFKYLSLPTTLPTSRKTDSPVKMSKCQTVRCRRDSYAHQVYMTPCTRSQAIDLSVDINCQNWPIIGYTSSWYNAMKYWKQCLQGSTSPSLPSHYAVFAQLFYRFAFPAILQPGTSNAYTGLWCMLPRIRKQPKNYCTRFFCFPRAVDLRTRSSTRFKWKFLCVF